MTNRERCLNLLRFQPVDRLPAVHFGYWRELLDEWAVQGKIPRDLAHRWGDGGDADRELDRIIGWDGNWACTRGCASGLHPSFERKVLETLPDGTQRIQNGDGLIERHHPGVVSIPEEDDYLLKDRKAFEELYLPKLQFTPDRVDWEYYRHFNENVYEKLDVPVGISMGSVLGTVRNWCSVVGLSYLMYDEDDETLLADIVGALADLQYKCVEAILSTGAKFDFGHYWEDICFNSGSLVSPDWFREVCGPHYRRRNDLCKAHGIDLFSLDCDGVTRQLTPIWYENGVNIMFPIEVGTWGDQFKPMRDLLGKGLLGIGGMDKTALRRDRAAVDAEIERMRRLAGEGGFIPCPDHRLMPGTKFELVQYYAEEIKKIVP